MLVEGNGVPLAVAVAGANRHDMKLAEPTLEEIVIERPKPTKKHPQNMCMDKGYDYPGWTSSWRSGDTPPTSQGEGSTSRGGRGSRATGRGGGSSRGPTHG